MAGDDPISAFIAAGQGVSATFTTPATGASGDYNPDATGSFVPGAPTVVTVVGLLRAATPDDVSQYPNATDIFVVRSDDLPAVTPGATTVRFALKTPGGKVIVGADYRILGDPRPRIFNGLVNGMQLALVR